MKDKITLSISDKKLSALEMDLAQKSTSLSAEVGKFAEQLYAKTVPQNVREYIEMAADSKPVRKPKPQKKSGDSTPPEQ